MPARKKPALKMPGPAAKQAYGLDFTALVDAIRQVHEQSAAAVSRAVNTFGEDLVQAVVKREAGRAHQIARRDPHLGLLLTSATLHRHAALLLASRSTQRRSRRNEDSGVFQRAARCGAQ